MNNRRAYLSLARQISEQHSTVSAIAPLVGFAIALTILVLLRITTSFAAVTARCIETDEFWYSSTGGNWPLIATFALILFLLLAWNLLTGIDDWQKSSGSKIMLAVNTIGIVAMLYFLTVVHGYAATAHQYRAGLYDSINISRTYKGFFHSESQCATMRRFVGRWRVVERYIGYYGFNVPAEWIEFKPWGVVYAQDETWLRPYTRHWHPPYQTYDTNDDRWRDGYLFDAPWDFVLQGDTLILVSPEFWAIPDQQKSKITLKRVPAPEEAVFPNPFAM